MQAPESQPQVVASEGLQEQTPESLPCRRYGKPTIDVAYNNSAMSKYLDLINLTTYDIHGGWEDRTGHTAPLYATAEDEALAGYPLSVSWALDYWLQGGASPSQVTLGLGTYGRGWTLADSSQTGFNAPA